MSILIIIFIVICAIFHAVYAIQQHEIGHAKHYDMLGVKNSINYCKDIYGKFSFRKLLTPSCDVRVEDIAQLTPEQCKQNLMAGCRRNMSIAKDMALTAILGFAWYKLSIINVNAGHAALALMIMVFMLIGAIIEALYAVGNWLPWPASNDGAKVRAITAAENDYKNEPTMKNLIHLEIVKLLGDYFSLGYVAGIYGNVAHVHSTHNGYEYHTMLRLVDDKLEIQNYNTKDHTEPSAKYTEMMDYYKGLLSARNRANAHSNELKEIKYSKPVKVYGKRETDIVANH